MNMSWWGFQDTHTTNHGRGRIHERLTARSLLVSRFTQNLLGCNSRHFLTKERCCRMISHNTLSPYNFSTGPQPFHRSDFFNQLNISSTMTEHHLKTSIAILGCGDVGSTLAYTLLLNPICSEVIMVDLKKELLEAQVRDLSDATYGGRAATKVRAGTHKDAGQADIIVITAGAKQKPGKYV